MNKIAALDIYCNSKANYHLRSDSSKPWLQKLQRLPCECIIRATETRPTGRQSEMGLTPLCLRIQMQPRREISRKAGGIRAGRGAKNAGAGEEIKINSNICQHSGHLFYGQLLNLFHRLSFEPSARITPPQVQEKRT